MEAACGYRRKAHRLGSYSLSQLYRQAPMQLAAPPASSLERIAHDYGQPFSIIVFRDWPDKDSPLSARPFGNVDMVGYWWRCFDLMFFIDQCSAKTVIYQRRSETE
jgi:hypothetical protein